MIEIRNEEFNNLNNPLSLTKILFEYTKIFIIELMKDLWNLNDIEIVLNFIRELSIVTEKFKGFDMIQNTNKFFVNLNVYFKLTILSFSNILGIIFSPQILKITFDMNEKL